MKTREQIWLPNKENLWILSKLFMCATLVPRCTMCVKLEICNVNILGAVDMNVTNINMQTTKIKLHVHRHTIEVHIFADFEVSNTDISKVLDLNVEKHTFAKSRIPIIFLNI